MLVPFAQSCHGDNIASTCTRVLRSPRAHPRLVQVFTCASNLSQVDCKRECAQRRVDHHIGCRYVLDMHWPQLRQHRISQDLDLQHWKFEGGKRKQEVLLYMVPLLVFDCVYPRRKLPELAPTLASLAADVFLSLFFYDLFFTVSHLAMHRVRLPCSVPTQPARASL